MALKSFKNLLAAAKLRDGYWVEKAKLGFSVELNRLFKHSGMTQSALAEKLATSPAYITKVFRGDANFTIETMVKLARAIEGELQIHIAPKQATTRWIDVMEMQQTHDNKASAEWVKSTRNANERISTAA